MNVVVSKILLARDKCMPEMHLKEPEFTYNSCGLFTKNKQMIHKNLKKQEIQKTFIKMN